MAIHGFYYDAQRKNKKTAITLHANMEKNGTEWGPWSGITFESNSEFPYGVDPICSGILTEDFGVSLTNSWAENDLGNRVQDIWNSNFRPFAPYAGKLLGGLEDIINNKYENKEKSTLVDVAQKGIGVAKNIAEWGAEHLNYALIVQGFRFTYFNGSSTNFKNLGLRFTLFPDWIDGEFVTVHDQIAKFTPYIIGEFVPIKIGDDDMSSVPDELKNMISSYASWQKPPGGFRADTKSIDIIQEGTLRLNLGVSYCIENLVISECNIEYSKTMAKVPTKEDEDIKMTPLYADVTMQLQPASMFSDLSFKNFSSGAAMEEIIMQEQQELKRKMDSQIKKSQKK